MKQNLYGVHRRPDHYCGSGFRSLIHKTYLMLISRQRPACGVSQSPSPKRWPKISSYSIKRRKSGKDTCEAWYNISKILFPNASLSGSTTATVSPMAVQSFSERFRSQAPPLLSTMVRDRTQDFVSRRIRTGDL